MYFQRPANSGCGVSRVRGREGTLLRTGEADCAAAVDVEDVHEHLDSIKIEALGESESVTASSQPSRQTYASNYLGESSQSVLRNDM